MPGGWHGCITQLSFVEHCVPFGRLEYGQGWSCSLRLRVATVVALSILTTAACSVPGPGATSEREAPGSATVVPTNPALPGIENSEPTLQTETPQPTPHSAPLPTPTHHTPPALTPTSRVFLVPTSTPYVPPEPSATSDSPPMLHRAPRDTPRATNTPRATPNPYGYPGPAVPARPPGSSPWPTPTLPTSPLPTPTLPTSPLPTPTLPTSPLPTPTYPASPLPTPTLPTSPLPTPTYPASPLPTPILHSIFGNL